MTRFLLDTGILLGFCRESEGARRLNEEHNLSDEGVTTAFTSVVCQGEILALAEKIGWEEKRRDLLEEILSGLLVTDINFAPILNAYARIDAWSAGKPVTAPNQTPPLESSKTMGKNDLWVAATAHVSEATLITTDKDFDHLNGIWFEVIYVDPKEMSRNA